LDPNVRSYSGYVDVAEDQHYFFWFFESRHTDPKEAPLTVWINGGPGSSSMIGLFQENGPCGIDENGEVFSNPYSWVLTSYYLFTSFNIWQMVKCHQYALHRQSNASRIFVQHPRECLCRFFNQ
jgi:hypothetical protein